MFEIKNIANILTLNSLINDLKEMKHIDYLEDLDVFYKDNVYDNVEFEMIRIINDIEETNPNDDRNDDDDDVIRRYINESSVISSYKGLSLFIIYSLTLITLLLSLL